MSRPLWCAKLWLTCSLIALAACASKNKAAPGEPADVSEETVLVDKGYSSQPSYSPSGERLLFVSKKRFSHSQPQVYEKNLATGEERRLTYQNGATFLPRYHPKEAYIVYSSTTDELKENSPLLRPAPLPSKLPALYQEPAEIYVHSLNGLEITRLTKHPGFDGEARFSPDGKQIVYTRFREDRASVLAQGATHGSPHPIAHLGHNPTSYVVSADKKISAWVDWDQDFGVARLMLKNQKAKPVELNSEHVVVKTELNLSSDGQYLLWAQANALSGNFYIWIYDGSCARIVAGRPNEDRRHPTFSPDMKAITYTLIRGERSRIVTLPFVPATGPCPGSD